MRMQSHTLIIPLLLMICGTIFCCRPAIALTPQEEMECGKMTARIFKYHYPMSTDKALIERVNRVGTALANSLDTHSYPYEFNVIADDELNAGALPGGYLFFHEGLLRKFNDDNAMAAVIGHELIHAAHRHYTRSQDKIGVTAIFASLLSLSIKDREMKVARYLTQLASLHYSRDDERDADESGIALAWKAGYDPNGAVKVMEVFCELEKGDTTPEYLRTHPKATSRLAAAKKRSAELIAKPRPTAPPEPIEVCAEDLVGKLPQQPIATNTLFPLAMGNYWVYSVTNQGAASQYSLEIVGEVKLKEGSVFRADTIIGASRVPCQLLTTDTGCWRRTRLGSPQSVWRPEHLFLTKPGDPLNQEGMTVVFVGEEALNIPCGDFPVVYHLKQWKDDPAKAVELWFAPHVGLLKRYNPQGEISEILTQYKVN